MGVLKARVSGVWVPITQGYTSATAGLVAQHTLTTPFTTTAPHTNFQDNGLTVTVNEIAGRTLRISFLSAGVYVPGGNNTAQLRLLRNGVDFRDWAIPLESLSTTVGWGFSGSTVVPITANASGVVYKTQIAGSPNNTSVSEYADSRYQRTLLVEDITTVQPTDGSLAGVWTAPSLGGSWVNVGGGYQTMQYRRVGDQVQIRGSIKSGNAYTAIFTLPVGFRPPANVVLPALYWNGSARVNGVFIVDAAGVCQMDHGSASVQTDILGSFSVSP